MSKLEEFLQTLLTDVRNNSISDNISSLLMELFLQYETEKKGSKLNVTKDESLKYYILGWYIYNNLK